MVLVWAGVLLVLMRFLELGPVAEWSWWWVLSPLAAAMIWFEMLEKPLGRDRRQLEGVEFEERRKKRVAQQFQELMNPRGKR